MQWRSRPACRQEAAQRRDMPAGIGRKLMQRWVGPTSTALVARREFKEGRSERLAVPQPPKCRSTAKLTRLALLHGGVPGRQPRGRERTIGQMAWASEAHRPPTSIPKTARRQRRAWPSSGYVWRLLGWAAWAKATPGRDSAPARGCPSRPTGLTMVASTARASWMGTSRHLA